MALDKIKISPAGWLRAYLNTQMHGLTGHIEKAGFPYDRKFWGASELPVYNCTVWWPFERTAYHIDGYVRAATLLRNGAQLAKARRLIYSVLESGDADGYLGPAELKMPCRCYRWPHVVFFRACLALYAYNGDGRIVEALTRHYLGCPTDHGDYRNALNIEIMLALYAINRDRRLLDMAVETYEKADVEGLLGFGSDPLAPLHIHGVTFNEFAKLGALLYRHTGNERYLRCSVDAYQKAAALCSLPGGCVSSDEFLRGNSYDACYETCDIADLTWSMHYLAEITDDGSYWDRIERCVFNSGIGSVLEDFKALQYFSCANQLVLNGTSSHAYYQAGNGAMRYATMPFTACCTGNVNRIMPNFIHSLWQQTGDVVTAQMYGPSRCEGSAGGEGYSIREETAYPFDLSSVFHVTAKKPFTLRLRIPGWCKGFHMKGATYRVQGDYAVVAITGNVKLELLLEADICRLTSGAGVYYTRGPLVYSLGMKGKRTPSDDCAFPDYSICPDKPWNYAVVGSGAPEFLPGRAACWDLDCDLPSIAVDARLVQSWKLTTVDSIISHKYDAFEKTGSFTQLPPLPELSQAQLSDEVYRIRLYPYGACKVRMTVLPQL